MDTNFGGNVGGQNDGQSRRILHLDGDAFFASVEIAKNPRLRGLPVVVGRERSIATALSYEAKARGISRGMPIWQIRRLCPEAVVLATDFTSYSMFSQRMIAIVRRYIDLVEEYSIDECFADMSEFSNTKTDKSGVGQSECWLVMEIMDKIAHDIETELDITVSLGLAPNKVLAKIASKWCKPKGKTVIGSSRPEIEVFLADLPVGKVWGIGSSTLISLSKLGVKTALDFARLPESVVKANLHAPHKAIWQELRGYSVMPVNPAAHEELPKSISRTATFHPFTRDRKRLLTEISRHVEEACENARTSGLFASHCSFFVKSQDFRISRAEVAFPLATNLPTDVMSAIGRNFDRLFRYESIESNQTSNAIAMSQVLWRASGVTLYGLRTSASIQTDLFGQSQVATRREEVFDKVDKLNNKFGSGTILLASSLGKGQHSHQSEILSEKSREWGAIRAEGGKYRKLSIPYMGEIN